MPRNFAPKQLNKIGPALLRCEELQATRLDHADGDPVADELLDLGVRAGSYTDGDPVVWIHLDVLGGFTTADMSNLDVELSSVLQSGTMQSKIDKLAKAQYDEQHLFLHVRPTALSFPIFEALSFGGQLPDTIPQLPSGLDQVWLASGWKAGGVVRAIANQGWLRSNPFD